MTSVLLLGSGLAAPPPGVTIEALDDLPLTLVPSRGETVSYAIFMTGDGGWAGLASSVAEALARHGVETVGFSTMRYYWSPKPPLRTAADLNRIFDAIRLADPKARIELIGFSYGAAIIPVVYPMLSDASKAMVDRFALMVPDAKAGIVQDGARRPAGVAPVYDFSTTFWSADDPAAGYDIAAAIRADAAALPITCIYPADDDGACPAVAKEPVANVALAMLGEGHHFGGDYTALADLILAKPRV